MANILQSLNRTIIAGIVLAVFLFFLMYSISGGWYLDTYFFSAFLNIENVDLK